VMQDRQARLQDMSR